MLPTFCIAPMTAESAGKWHEPEGS